MKTILAKLLAVALIVVMVLSLASCGAKPELDLEDAAENLEDKDYLVRYIDDKDELELNEVATLYASNDDDFLRVVEYKDAKSAKLAYEEIKMEYDLEIQEIKVEIEAIELEIKFYEHMLDEYDKDLDSDDIDDLEEEIDDLNDEIKDLEKNLEKYKEEYSYGRSGKFVWAGTVDAIEDSKK